MVGRLIAVEGEDVRPFGGEQPSARRANPRCRAGDDRDASLQPAA
jgi:hypothetical protein